MTAASPDSAEQPLLERCSPTLLPELKHYVEMHHARIASKVCAGGASSGLEASRCHARAFDGLLGAVFQAAEAVMRGSGSWVEVSLAAVGSYGRGTLGLHSDLDLRLLAEKSAEAARPVAEALLYPLWDAGISVGHQVVTVEESVELARDDLPSATSLLDWRLLAGDKRTTQELSRRVHEGVFGEGAIRRFLRALRERAEERHERYGGSVYLLEPDVRNGPGGLRDLDIAHWAARARWRVEDLADLVRLGVLVPREWEPIEAARDQLWSIRNCLHLHARRRMDRLSFERQEQLAVDLGYGEGGAAVERLMSDYYRHARALIRARDIIMARALPAPTRKPHLVRVGRGLCLINGELTLEHPVALAQTPSLALRLYAEAVRRATPVSESAREVVTRLSTAPESCEKLRQSPEAAGLMSKLVSAMQPTELRQGSVLAELHDVGLLTAMVPEFAPVVGRVHHDVYHTLTVDVHSVAAVDWLRRLYRGELAEAHPLASRLAAEVARRSVLCWATLLHDVGKDIGGRNHSERGAVLAEQILQRYPLDNTEREQVCFLVKNHLKMYHFATRRDVDDPRTLEEFSAVVRDREGLKELYLLTLADLSTTSPTALTTWKTRMLEDLYVTTDRFLEGTNPRVDCIDQGIDRVLELWQGEGRDDVRAFLRAMPARYLLANRPQHVLDQIAVVREAEGRPATVRCLGTDEPYVELAFVLDDRPGLLAMIAATLAAARLGVLGAQIYSWTEAGRTRALDLFWVRGPSGARGVVDLIPRIERALGRLVLGELSAEDVLPNESMHSSWSERPTPEVQTKLNIDNRASSSHTVIEVVTRDHAGLLFHLASTLQRCDLMVSLAKINTEGKRVADVFYVTDANGSKLLEPERIRELERRLVATVARLELEDQK